MKPGDLVKMKPMKGFSSWWSDKTFILLEEDPEHVGWVSLLTDEGRKIQVTVDILEVLQ